VMKVCPSCCIALILVTVGAVCAMDEDVSQAEKITEKQTHLNRHAMYIEVVVARPMPVEMDCSGQL
jgi:hypothetical protein